MTNVFLYGSSGTGKTIMSAEIVKIKLSQLMANKNHVQLIVEKSNIVFTSIIFSRARML